MMKNHWKFSPNEINKSNKEIVVVGLGEILWDIFPDGKQLGGAPANFTYFANSFGFQGVIVSCIGNDPPGREILDQLAKKQLNTNYIIVDPKHPTGTVTVELDNFGKPDYTIHENTAWDNLKLDFKIKNLAQQADVVCYGSLGSRSFESRQSIEEFLTATKDNCLKVFDINIRKNYYSKNCIIVLLDLATIFKLNDEELPLVSDLLDINGNETEILKQIVVNFQLQLIILTKGAGGSRLISPEDDDEIQGIKTINIVDTVGAGDSFTATVISGYLRGKSLKEMNQQANIVAAFVCSQQGAMPDLPSDYLEE